MKRSSSGKCKMASEIPTSPDPSEAEQSTPPNWLLPALVPPWSAVVLAEPPQLEVRPPTPLRPLDHSSTPTARQWAQARMKVLGYMRMRVAVWDGGVLRA